MILQGDCRDILKTLPDKSVHCVVTSPPYWGLRDYGVAGQIGLEKTPDEYVATMVQVFREIKRALRDDGTLWLNLGDSYAHNGPCGGGSPDGEREYRKTDKIKQEMMGYKVPPGLKPKDLCGIPWRVAFALQGDGWYLRSDIIWHKPNPMPESVTDRPTKSHEYVFLMSKSARYYYDAEAVKEPAKDWGTRDRSNFRNGTADPLLKQHGLDNANNAESGRNLRSVWTIATQPSSEAHFAMFPEALVVPCIKAGTSEYGVCPECGAPWERVVDKNITGNRGYDGIDRGTDKRGIRLRAGETNSTTLGWSPTCKCGRDDRVQSTVLDPFSGMATVGVVCNKLGRKYIGIELNPKYADRSGDRKDKAENLFSDVV